MSGDDTAPQLRQTLRRQTFAGILLRTLRRRAITRSRTGGGKGIAHASEDEVVGESKWAKGYRHGGRMTTYAVQRVGGCTLAPASVLVAERRFTASFIPAAKPANNLTRHLS